MNQVTLQVSEIEEKIARSVNPEIAGSLAISDSAGGLAFANVEQVMQIAKLMSVSQVAVPKHLRGNPGACIAVCIQAIEWRMSPFAVANKSYSVNDRMAYEAQLINAVILQRAPIKGRLKVEYIGIGGKRQCKIWATLKDNDEVVEYLSPEFDKIQPKNSPLWKTDPDQQHFYNASRAFCRRHFPDVLLGVYAKDEIEDGTAYGPERARDVTPKPSLASRLKPVEAVTEGFSVEHIDAETGEIIEVVEQAAAVVDADADESETVAEAEAEATEEETLIDKARAAAMAGSGALLRWRNALTDAEKEEIKPQLDALKAAAKAADGAAS